MNAETKKKYKVALIHNIIAPYRVPLFEALFNHPSIDLFVYFCAKTHKVRDWDVLENSRYNYEVLRGTTLEFTGFTYHINPSIVPKLVKKRYDAVIIGGSVDFTTQVAFILSKLLGFSIILWSEEIKSGQSFFGRLPNPLTKYVAKKTDAIIVPGTIARDFCVSPSTAREKIFIAPNTVDNEKFFYFNTQFKREKQRLKQELNIQNEKVILFVGQLIKRKGVEYLIKAYKKLKNEYCDVCLIIIGDGVLKDQLSELSISQNIKDVHFTGWVSEEKKITYYSIADLFVLPTLRDVWGLVVNEAMCCGLPVVATKVAGCAADMIYQGENGFIVNPADVDQLYKAIKGIILNNELAHTMSQRSREIINNNFSIDNAINGFVSAIKYAYKMEHQIS